jgi:hypothetical protein
MINIDEEDLEAQLQWDWAELEERTKRNESDNPDDKTHPF